MSTSIRISYWLFPSGSAPAASDLHAEGLHIGPTQDNKNLYISLEGKSPIADYIH